MSVTLSVIIPTLNEERTVGRVIRRLLATPFPGPYEVIVVDDHSADGTFAIERALARAAADGRITVVRNRTGTGKGACIREGLRHATGDLVVIQDGDIEYDPAELPKLLAPILAGRAEVVYGSRFLGARRPRGMRWAAWAANRALTGLTNLLYGVGLTDMETCYKVLRRGQLRSLHLQAVRFEFEPEVTAKLARAGVRITEVPVSYSGRDRAHGKKIRGRDFFIAVWTLLRCRWSRTR